jgi:hypothetical protein
MTLPKEWHELAQREAQETTDIEKFSNQGDYNKALNAAEYDYLQGATAYKQAVHKLLSDRQQELLADKINAVGEEEQAQYDLLIVEIALFLNKLKSLTPTSND